MQMTQAVVRGVKVDPPRSLEARAAASAARGQGEVERIHGSVFPADVRAGDPVFAQLSRAQRTGAGRPTAWQVWRISPLGVELVRPPETEALSEGTLVDLTLRLGESVTDFRGLKVLFTERERGKDLVAVSWGVGQARCRAPGDERKRMRWACGSDFSPTGIAPSAVRYGDFVYFKVTDISSEGMQLETSLRNKYLLPGVTIESTCTFPTLGQVRLDLKILHARVAQRGRKSVLSLGVRYTPLDARTTETIGQYLLQFGAGATVQDLCGAGFRITHSARALDFCSVRTPEEYREVLKLRRLAYQHAKKVSQDAKDVDMGDGFDNSSRILVAKHRGRIVGTVRLMFPKTQSDPLKHDEFLPLPPDLPSRDQLVEVSKACTHPSYRGSDLFYTLLKHVALTAIQAGRRYALMSATDSLAPIYLRFGFRQLGASYDHPSMRLRHHLMLLDLKRVVAGRGINPIFWNLMGGYEIWSYARRCGALEEDPWLSARARFLRLFSPLARLVQALYARRLRARESAK